MRLDRGLAQNRLLEDNSITNQIGHNCSIGNRIPKNLIVRIDVKFATGRLNLDSADTSVFHKGSGRNLQLLGKFVRSWVAHGYLLTCWDARVNLDATGTTIIMVERRITVSLKLGVKTPVDKTVFPVDKTVFLQ